MCFCSDGKGKKVVCYVNVEIFRDDYGALVVVGSRRILGIPRCPFWEPSAN